MLKWPLLAALAAMVAAIPACSLYAQDAPRDEQRGAPAAASSSDTGTAESASERAEITAPLPRGKKLILTDGSFHVVREYGREGERVRYYSVERSGWEEIPSSLVDWAATEKAAAEMEALQNETVERLHAAATDDLAASIDSGSSLQTSSGVILPDPPGFYVLDGQQVLSMEQVMSASRLDKGRAILKAISGLPLISTKHIIEIPGKRAKLRVRSAQPEFYFRTADGRSPQLALVRAGINGDKRQVSTAVTDLTGTTKYEHRELPMMTSEAARGVQRLTLDQKLEPGEYALVETTAEGISSYIWDFGVDPAPAANNSQTNKNTEARPAAKPNPR
jgi:hypothetical protein